MSEKKPNTPAEFSVQSQDISDETLETVAGGMTATTHLNLFLDQKDSSSETMPDGRIIRPEDTLFSPLMARTSF